MLKDRAAIELSLFEKAELHVISHRFEEYVNAAAALAPLGSIMLDLSKQP